jgi:AcrR family transcriptional regulator
MAAICGPAENNAVTRGNLRTGHGQPPVGTIGGEMLRPNVDQRKIEILDAAVQVIIEVGFTEMTVADVAKVAGVSTALVHYHFSSKVELITAALRRACDDDKELRDSVADGPGSAVHRLDRVLCGSLPSDLTDASWLLWIETWGETRRLPALRDAMDELSAHEIAVIDRLFAEGEHNREFMCDDHAGAAARLSALRDGLAIQQTLFGAGTSSELYIDEFRGGVCLELGLSRAEYDRLAAISS